MKNKFYCRNWSNNSTSSKIFLYSLKPLGTPKLAKARKPKFETFVESVVDIEVVQLPVVLELDSILDKIGK